MLSRKYLTEEFIQVDVEVVYVAVLADEGDSLPAGVRTLPDVPRIASNGDIRSLERADRLNTIVTGEETMERFVSCRLTRQDRRARS